MSVIIKNAPKLELLIDGKVKLIYSFQEASLKEIRAMASLAANYNFFYEGLVVSQFEESFIFVKEIAYGSKIIISSSKTTPIIVPRPNPVPTLPIAPIVPRPMPKPSV
jgi:hypothetical protein